MQKFIKENIKIIKESPRYSTYRYSFDNNIDFIITIKDKKLFDYVVVKSTDASNILINGQILNSSLHINSENEIAIFNEFIEYVTNNME